MTLTNLNPQEQLIQQRLNELNVSNENAATMLELARNASIPLLPQALGQLEELLRRQAALDIVEQVAQGSMTALQIRSVFYGALLNRSRTVDYASFEFVYHILSTIRNELLAQNHPANYTSVQGTEDRSFLVMAEAEAGIPNSVASDIMTLGDIVLPYVEEELGIPRVQVWSSINSTNLRSMIPVLRILINMVRDTGDNRRPAPRVQEAAAEVQRRWAATQTGDAITPDNAAMAQMTPEQQQEHLNTIAANRRRVDRHLEGLPVRHRVRGTIGWLLDNGQAMPTRDFARLVANRNDEPFDVMIYQQGALRHIVATLTDDQWDTFQRVVRNRMNPVEVQTLQDLWRRLGNGAE